MRSDDALGLTIAALSPGVFCVLAGTSLALWASIRGRAPSRHATLLGGLGIGLMSFVPGLMIVVLVASGRLMWPAALFGVFTMAIGIAVFGAVRRVWASRTVDPS